MRKGRDGEKKKKNGKKKTDENSGHYVIASSRPPERRPPTAGTLHARANIPDIEFVLELMGGLQSHIHV